MALFKQRISSEAAAGGLHLCTLNLMKQTAELYHNALPTDSDVRKIRTSCSLPIDQNILNDIRVVSDWEHYYFISSQMYLMLYANQNALHGIIAGYLNVANEYMTTSKVKYRSKYLSKKFEFRREAYNKSWTINNNSQINDVRSLLQIITSLVITLDWDEIDNLTIDYIDNPSMICKKYKNASEHPNILLTELCIAVITNVIESLNSLFKKYSIS